MEQGELKLKDPARWDTFVKANNDDPYGAGIVHFAERWARGMQFWIDDAAQRGLGETVEVTIARVAKGVSHEADDEGITGYMYGVAVEVLAQCWEHGEALRRWHNLDAQIHDEGERANVAGTVLNPALVTIEEK